MGWARQGKATRMGYYSYSQDTHFQLYVYLCFFLVLLSMIWPRCSSKIYMLTKIYWINMFHFCFSPHPSGKSLWCNIYIMSLLIRITRELSRMNFHPDQLRINVVWSNLYDLLKSFREKSYPHKKEVIKTWDGKKSNLMRNVSTTSCCW